MALGSVMFVTNITKGSSMIPASRAEHRKMPVWRLVVVEPFLGYKLKVECTRL